ISVFVGVQPVLMHVPPNSLRSMIATVLPAATNRRAKAGPDCPVPMIIASKLGMLTSDSGALPGGAQEVHFLEGFFLFLPRKRWGRCEAKALRIKHTLKRPKPAQSAANPMLNASRHSGTPVEWAITNYLVVYKGQTPNNRRCKMGHHSPDTRRQLRR